MKNGRIQLRIESDLKARAMKKAQSRGMKLTDYITCLVREDCDGIFDKNALKQVMDPLVYRRMFGDA